MFRVLCIKSLSTTLVVSPFSGSCGELRLSLSGLRVGVGSVLLLKRSG